MADRQLKARRGERECAPEDAVEVEASASRESLDLTDEFLDEIDGVLEANAEEFVRAYVQKGGE